ncbi:hypothetical protein LTR08_001133 [Meristemomyces frigidus]|nr:hypothetical protein LTR08_001133 [Meristemomyces frigidus]
MQFTTLLTTLTLALITTANPTRPSPNTMVLNDLNNGVKCANRDGGSVNALITNFCRHNHNGDTLNGVTVGTEWARGGLRYNGMKVSITGANCPANSKWVPSEYCEGQFTWMCATGGPKGGNVARFGVNGCQTWKIEKHA